MRNDTILRDECLVKPDDWTSSGLDGGRSVRLDGRPATLLPDAPEVRIPFPRTSQPLGQYNQIAIDLHFTEVAHVLIILETGHLSPGFDTPDELHTTPGLPRKGWWRVTLPLTSFLPLGLSSDFSRVTALRFKRRPSPGRVALGELRIQTVEQARGPRLSDEEFLTELDLSRPELADVKALWSAGNLEAALRRVDEHFRTRSTPHHFFYETIPVAAPPTIRQADRLCDHWINGFRFPDGIDWRANPTGYQEWPAHLFYMSWTTPLVSAYLATLDEKYARRLDEIIASFIMHNPRPLDHSGGGGPWGPHRPSARATRCWPFAFYATLEAVTFRWRTRVDMLKSWWEMTEHSLRWSWPGNGNPRMSDSRAIAMAGMLLPEFRRASGWREEGLARLQGDTAEQILADGVHYEAAGYHTGCLTKLCEIYALANLNGVRLPAGLRGTIDRMFNWLVHGVRPCGTRIVHNDPGGFQQPRGSFPHILGMVAEQLRRTDVAFIDRGAGSPPAEASCAFPNTGFYLMRSGWDRDDLCLFFDGGIIGKSHSHEDKLSIDLSAFGREFIVDPGIQSYMLDRFTHYFRSSHAHSTIQVDGQGQNRIGTQSRQERVRDVAAENEWQSGPVFDYARSQYIAGYGPAAGKRPQAIVHHRAVIFVKNDYFLVFDLVAGEGRHLVESVLQFAPLPVLVDEATATLRTWTSGGPNLEVIYLPGLPTPETKIICGATSPPRGWVAPQMGAACPAPSARLAWRQELPLTAGMLLVPSRTGEPVGLRITVLLAETGAWVGRLAWPDGRHDWVLVRFADDGEVELDGVRTDGRVAIVRYSVDGTVTASAQYGGATLACGEKGRDVG